MVEVVIDSIRVSLMSQHRLVVLKDTTSERFLTIFIGPCEADAITIHLQTLQGGSRIARPMTHDLLKSVMETLGGRLTQIVINDLREEVYYAELVVDVDGAELRIDSRPSDAIALAVRAEVPIFVDESVMDRAATTPEEEISDADEPVEDEKGSDSDDDLDIFADFVDTLGLDDLD
ncbi:MAG: bifunctional nuclease family protein [Anaerolineae bacterium]|nr:bifunctional nuclease family protein [Anaerolineae bacterium]